MSRTFRSGRIISSGKIINRGRICNKESLEDLIAKIRADPTMNDDRKKELIDFLTGKSLSVQGVTYDKISMPDDLRKAIGDYYKGKGIPVDVLKKYYGYGKGLTVNPDPEAIKTQYY